MVCEPEKGDSGIVRHPQVKQSILLTFQNFYAIPMYFQYQRGQKCWLQGHRNKIKCIFIKTQPIFMKLLWGALNLQDITHQTRTTEEDQVFIEIWVFIWPGPAAIKIKADNCIISNNFINFYQFFKLRWRNKTSQQDAATAAIFAQIRQIDQKLRSIEC